MQLQANWLTKSALVGGINAFLRIILPTKRQEEKRKNKKLT